MHFTKRTKIIATLGPASESPEIIEQLIKAGVNVFRFNMKQNVLGWHQEKIQLVRSITKKLNVTVGIYIDLQGPEIRVKTRNGETYVLAKGDQVYFTTDFANYTDKKTVLISHHEIFAALKTDDAFSIDDGINEFKVLETLDDGFIAEAIDKCEIANNKGMNLVGKDVKIPSLTDVDIDRLKIGKLEKADFVGLSFTRRKEDLDLLRAKMKSLGISAKIVAKVESHVGVENIDEIIEHSDVVMVARGDLGVEVPFERVTYIQKELIRKCREAHKPVIVATQMLESMITKPRPTRAEVADVSNAVFDGTDCVMLSGETASGNYPVKAVEAMARILKYSEEKANFSHFSITPKDQTQLLVNSVISMIHSKGALKVDRIVVFTETGYTARVLSSFRGHTPIIAVSNRHETVDALTVSYGVIPVEMEFPTGNFMMPEQIMTKLILEGYLKEGELLLVVHGKRWNDEGGTNAVVLVTL